MCRLFGKAIIFAIFSGIGHAQLPTEEYVDRVFECAHAQTVQQMREITMAIRQVTDVRQVLPDDARKTLKVRGTARQIAFAEWLFYELDKPINTQAIEQHTQHFATQEFRVDVD